MTIDMRAARAAVWVHGQAEQAPIPEIDELLERQRQRKNRRAVRGAVVLLVVLGLAAALALVVRPEDRTPPASTSSGYQHVEQPTLGFAVDIPSTWVDHSSTSVCTGGGWLYCATRQGATGLLDDGLLAFHLVPTPAPFTADDVERMRVARLQTAGATIKETKRVRVDGHDAVQIHYVLPSRALPGRSVEDVELDVLHSPQLVVGLIVVQDSARFDPKLPPSVLKTMHLRGER